MKYEVIVDAERRVAERYRVTVEADNEEEAQDIAWEIVDDPSTDLRAERKFKEREATIENVVIYAEVQIEGWEADDVFDDGT